MRFPCSQCKAPCYDKPGPTSTRGSYRARVRTIIKRVNMDKTTPTSTWFAPMNQSWQQPTAGNIPIFQVWRNATKGNAACRGN